MPELDPNDVCQYGHQLAPGSEPIKITTTDPETGKILKEETFLLRRHALPQSRFDPTGLAPAVCEHGLPEHPDGLSFAQAAGGPLGGYAKSWIRSKYLRPHATAILSCPVCRGEEAPADMLVAANA